MKVARPIPKLLVHWVKHCDVCRGTGTHPPDIHADLANCYECSGWGYLLNEDGEAAVDFLFGLVKKRLHDED